MKNLFLLNPLLCLISTLVVADNLVSLGDSRYPTVTGVIIQSMGRSELFNARVVQFWSAPSCAGYPCGSALTLIRRTVVDPAKYYTMTLTQFELEAIKDRWKRSGISAEVEFVNGTRQTGLNNCRFTWTTPSDVVVISGKCEHLTVTIETRHSAISLLEVDSIEVLGNDRWSIIPKGGGPAVQEELLPPSFSASGNTTKHLVPSLQCHTYEADGTFAEDPDEARPFFKQHNIRFSAVRRIHFLADSSK